MAGLTLLNLNGAIFKAAKGEIEDFAVQVATDHLDVTIIAAWLKAHSEEISHRL